MASSDLSYTTCESPRTSKRAGRNVVSTSQSPDASTSTSRLRRSDKERIRVSRACDRCKGKKVRCSGKQPCVLCTKLKLSCEFNARYTRGRLPQIEVDKTMLPTPVAKVSNLMSVLHSPDLLGSFSPHSPCHQKVLDHQQAHTESDCTTDSNPTTPEVLQTTTQPRHEDTTGGPSFLLRVQKRLDEMVSSSLYPITFSSYETAIPAYDPQFVVLPPFEYAQQLVARYFEVAVPTYRYFHRPTVDLWLDEIYGKIHHAHELRSDGFTRAALFMIFAQAEEHGSVREALDKYSSSVPYFHAAEYQLQSETAQICLTSIQARLAQCFYLLSTSRIDHSWALFGTTAHSILALDIHRRRGKDSMGKIDFIDLECRRRVFWTAYMLDVYLSTALGRPRTFHDDDIDQDLPSMSHDEQITVHQRSPWQSSMQSIMLAPICHIRLAQIIGTIIRDMYSVRHIQPDLLETHAIKHTEALRVWRYSINRFLVAPSEDVTPLLRKQQRVLQAAHAHASILIHRPFLLSNFAHPCHRNYGSFKPERIEQSVAECLEAAMSVVGLIDVLCGESQCLKAFWFVHYYAFSSVVILYVHAIQQRSNPRSVWQTYLAAAEKCHKQLFGTESKQPSLHQRYCVVLEELRQEARRHKVALDTNLFLLNWEDKVRDREIARTIMQLSQAEIASETGWNGGSSKTTSAGALHYQKSPEATHLDTSHLTPGLLSTTQSNRSSVTSCATPRNSYHDTLKMTPVYSSTGVTGWGEFDSFVSAGLGLSTMEAYDEFGNNIMQSTWSTDLKGIYRNSLIVD